MVFDFDKNFSLLPLLGSENTDNAGSLSTGSILTNPCHSTNVLARRNARETVSDPVLPSVGTGSLTTDLSDLTESHARSSGDLPSSWPPLEAPQQKTAAEEADG